MSAVMHTDERNSAMSEALGEDVYHYHFHAVYIPVVEKQILWSKRCKDKSLVGTVKETIMQVSNSKKWEYKQPLRSKENKAVLPPSYSILQDDFFQAIRQLRGASDRDLFQGNEGKRASESCYKAVAQTEQALLDTTVVAEKQEQKLEALQKETKTAKTLALSVQDIEAMGKPQKFTGNMVLTASECDTLKNYAVKGIMANAENKKLKTKLADASRSAEIWKKRFEELQKKAQPYLDALEIAFEKVRAFLSVILARGKDAPEYTPSGRRHQWDMEL